jgi:altronate dehydratase large subunit
MEFLGYRRSDGKVGVRNHVLILSTVVCANEVAHRIERRIPSVAVATHPFGCGILGGDFEQFKRTLVGFAKNPNVGAVLIVGLGCEQVDAPLLAVEIARGGKLAEALLIQECEGIQRAVRRGVKAVREMQEVLAREERVPSPVSELIVATECGGSDFSSGLAANPAVGFVSDRLIELGGTVVLSETSELIGAEHLLAARANDEGVARRIYGIVERVEGNAVRSGVDIRGSQPTPGNIRGGITTIEEKSLGCIYKAGTRPIRGVVEYAEPVRGKGLWIMDTPGMDVESITGMAAGGAQIVVFTTGLGTPVGCPIAPVIKVTGNPETARKMRAHIDVDAGEILKGRDTIEGVGERIFRLLLEVASGKQTKAERWGHGEFGINRIGVTL